MIGVDKYIQEVGVHLSNKITGLTFKGRAYVNTRKVNEREINIPETLNGTRYTEVLPDKRSSHGFATVGDSEAVTKVTYNAEVTFYFSVDLSSLYQGITERATEYLHRDIVDVFKHSKFEVTRIAPTWEGDFDFDKPQMNMQPNYMCKVVTTLRNYSFKNNC